MANAPITPLSILGAAVTACHEDRLTKDLSNREIRRVLELGSPVVVAEELRRIADEPGMGFMTGPHDVSAAARLRARADELDPDELYTGSPAVRVDDEPQED